MRRLGVSAAVLAAALAAASPATAARLRLFHDSFSTTYRTPGGAVPAGTQVTLRVRTSGAKSTRATLRVYRADPLNDRTSRTDYRMRRSGALWSATFRTPSAPSLVFYTFRVRSGRSARWYGDDGDQDDDVRQGGTGTTTGSEPQGFQLTVYDPRFAAPAWLKGALVYEIFVDRFRNGDRSNDYCRSGSSAGCPLFYGNVPVLLHPTWNEPLEDSRATGVFNRDFFGGDLAGIEQQLPYLKQLGVEAVWLTPIFKARSNHRYDTDDYEQVDPGLGGDGAFTSLVAAARIHGIRLILDGVFNHTSSDSRYFDRYHRYAEDGACESTGSPYRAWYGFSSARVPCTTGDYAAFFNLDTLPALDHANASVRDFLYRGPNSVVRRWSERGAAGWRLDAADQVPHDFWRDFRAVTKSYAPDAPLVAEVWPDASAYLLGNEFDSVMNYRFRRAVLGFVRGEDWTDSSGAVPALTPSSFDRALHAIREDYPPDTTATSFNLIDSHDTNRALYVLTRPGDSGLVEARERLRLAALFQLTYLGAPMIYYGDEVAIDAPGRAGFGDPYNRAPFPWLDESGNVDVYGPPDEATLVRYTTLARLRRERPALRIGAFETVLAGDTTGSSSDDDVLAFVRAGGALRPVLVVLNRGAQPETATLPVRTWFADGTPLGDALGVSVQATVQDGSVRVTVGPRSGLVLVQG